ncbi:MAG: MarR family transcriptional regulator [Chloroflexaceae bacterium]|nr:MarR family transcriptional regulator [Chloroflexaceae bacterium]NJL33825.1 MarR family transcriptional regulator [Chloroflexaceae bacterium]NJO04177.1 MarR family transcriptional regulator [Chloroflexaceae bacterium]
MEHNISPRDRQLIEIIGKMMDEHMQASVPELLAVKSESRLSMPQIAALHILKCDGPLSISAMAQNLGLSLAATSHLVEQLVQQGFLERSEDINDRRHKQLRITSKGLAITQRLVDARLRVLTNDILCLPEDLRARLFDVLHEIVAFFKTQHTA